MQEDLRKILGKNREGKEGEIQAPDNLFLKIYVIFAKFRDQMRGSVTTWSSTKDRVRGQTCNGRNRTTLSTGENVKVQTVRHVWL